MKKGSRAFSVQKVGGRLEPVGRFAEQKFAALPTAKPFLIEAANPRNIRQHNLYWLVLTAVHEATQRYPNIDLLHDALLYEAGVVDTWMDIHGEIRMRPGAMAISAMPEEKFREYFSTTMDRIREHFFPGMDQRQRAYIDELIDGEWGRMAKQGGR